MVCVWRLVLATFACVGGATPAPAEAARLAAEAALKRELRVNVTAVAARDAAENSRHSNQTGSTGAIDVTDGCERNWLFQVSTGRSGSTSLMNMLNDLPNVYIAGENAGLFESLYALHKSSIRTRFRERRNSAWWHHPVDRSKLRRIVRTYVESAIGLKQNQNYAWVGFKEIRFETDDELDYLLSLFPCSKVIVNIRRDVVGQHKSRATFKKATPIPISALKSQNDMLLKWSEKHPNRVFTLALEDFNLDNFDRLAVWLDFPNCHFKQIAHANRGGYRADKRHFVTC